MHLTYQDHHNIRSKGSHIITKVSKDYDLQARKIRGALVGIVVFIFIIPFSCSVVKKPTPIADLEAHPQLTKQEYTIQPGDELDIKYFYNKELNERVTVRPVGRISLQLAY